MLEMSRSRPRKDRGKLRPGIRGTHVDDAHRFDARPRGLGAEQGRGLAILDTAPEFSLGGFQMRVSESFLRMVDDWRRGQIDVPSRAEAIRRMVELAAKMKKKPDADRSA
jgi:hypothetical protein